MNIIKQYLKYRKKKRFKKILISIAGTEARLSYMEGVENSYGRKPEHMIHQICSMFGKLQELRAERDLLGKELGIYI
jgi:hypothetical protein